MNEEEAKKIIDNMSEQELNDFIFFALKEVEKENQKLKTELKKKDKIIEYMANFINDNTPYTKDTRILENERGVRNTKYTEQYFENKVTDTNVGERKVENGN